jgi:hypothetical protein
LSEEQNGTLRYRVDRLEREHEEFVSDMKNELREVNHKLDRLMVAIVGGLLTLSLSLILVAATTVVHLG